MSVSNIFQWIVCVSQKFIFNVSIDFGFYFVSCGIGFN